MGKKRKRNKEKKFWCFYCDRRFLDEKVLVTHQRSKHFKCHVCYKKLTSASGVKTHCYKIHRQHIFKVPNAKQGRDSFKFEVYGMEGIPKHFLRAMNDASNQGERPLKKQKVTSTDVQQTIVSLSENSDNTQESQQQKEKNQPVASKNGTKEYFIYMDNEFSMEERRAMLPKYKE